jgi:integrase
MPTRINPKNVAELQPGDMITDTEVKGFRARRWKSGHVTYDYRYRTVTGERRSIPIGRHGDLSTEQARTLAKKRAWEVANETDPAKERQVERATSSNTVSAVWDAYAKRELATKRSAAAQISAFDRLVRPRIGDRPNYDLKRSDMAKLFDAIEDTNGIAMSDAMLRYLGTCFRRQQIRDENFNSPIIPGMARTSTKERARKRVLDDAELRAVWKATDAPTLYHRFIRFLVLTGCRRDEGRELPWNEIKGDVWTLPGARNKTKQELVRPLSDDAMAALPQRPDQDGLSTLVFPGTGGGSMGSPGERKAKLDRDSGTSGWTLHDLRRTARSLMSRAGVQSDVAELCLGHVLPGIRATYDRHSYLDEKREAFEKLAATIRTIVG